MQWGEPPNHLVEHSPRSVYDLTAMNPGTRKIHPFTFGIHTTTPPPTNPLYIMQRADEVGIIQRMLNDVQTSAVILIGNPGAGKSTLAALMYNRMLLTKQKGLPAPRYLVWLTIGTYTTLPDIIAGILAGINKWDPGFFLLKPEQQISTLLEALRHPQQNAFIVLDQFESLLHPEVNQGVAGRGVLPRFLEMLQSDLGASRILLTSYSSPYSEALEETRVRSCLISRISIPEGFALLQQRGVQGSPEELSLVWQRCGGHVFALVLFSAFVHLSGMSLSYLLNSPDSQPLWSGEVTSQLIASVHHYLNPIQYVLMRTLGLFDEPVPLAGIAMAITGNSDMGTDGRSLAVFEHELGTLNRLSLVQISLNTSGGACYLFHPLLRQYVLEHYLEGDERRRCEALASLGIDFPLITPLDTPDALQTALATGHERVATYYQHIAHEQNQGPQGAQYIIAAVRHLGLGKCWQPACDLLFAEKLHESMVQWGAWNTLIGLYTGLLPPFGTLVRRDQALVCSHVGMLYGRMGEYQQSQSYFEQALTMQRQLGDHQGEATTLANQGELYRMRNEYPQARKNFERALELNGEKQDQLLRCILLHNLGLLCQREQEYQQALDYYLESLRLAYRLQGQQNKGMILTNLGMLLYEQGQPYEGVAILLAALQLRRAVQDPSASVLEMFLHTLEQRMGTPAYTRLCQSALQMQQEVFSRFIPSDVRQ